MRPVCKNQKTLVSAFSSKASDYSGNDSFNEFREREQRKEQEFDWQSKAEKTNNNESKQFSIDEDQLNELEIKILEAALDFVNEHGWSKLALSKGAEMVGVASTAQGMFERGGAELIDYFNNKCNQQLIQFMEKLIAESAEPLSPPKFTAKAIEFRLRFMAQYKAQWPQALGIMALPQNVPTALSTLLTMADDICFYAGDRSVDVRIVFCIVFL